MKACSVEGCKEPYNGNGLCRSHAKYGLSWVRKKRTIEQRTEFKKLLIEKRESLKKKIKERRQKAYELRLSKDRALYACDRTYREGKRARAKHHMRNNMDKALAKKAKRRAQKLKATPVWLTDIQHRQIQDVYTKAQQMKRETSIVYHVDHIVPLQGLNVCGLHVPWNLQILEARENIAKGNRLVA